MSVPNLVDKSFVHGGVKYVHLTNTEKSGLFIEIYRRLQRSPNFNIIIREQANDVSGHPIGPEWAAVFVADGQKKQVYNIARQFLPGINFANRHGADHRYF